MVWRVQYTVVDWWVWTVCFTVQDQAYNGTYIYESTFFYKTNQIKNNKHPRHKAYHSIKQTRHGRSISNNINRTLITVNRDITGQNKIILTPTVQLRPLRDPNKIINIKMFPIRKWKELIPLITLLKQTSQLIDLQLVRRNQKEIHYCWFYNQWKV